jgi:hypothetical protein
MVLQDEQEMATPGDSESPLATENEAPSPTPSTQTTEVSQLFAPPLCEGHATLVQHVKIKSAARPLTSFEREITKAHTYHIAEHKIYTRPYFHSGPLSKSQGARALMHIITHIMDCVYFC